MVNGLVLSLDATLSVTYAALFTMHSFFSISSATYSSFSCTSTHPPIHLLTYPPTHLHAFIPHTKKTMKEEMELVQGMESAEERDAEQYLESLESLLKSKAAAVASLRMEVDSFCKHRTATAMQREGR
jgi:hypothetical protein